MLHSCVRRMSIYGFSLLKLQHQIEVYSIYWLRNIILLGQIYQMFIGHHTARVDISNILQDCILRSRCWCLISGSAFIPHQTGQCLLSWSVFIPHLISQCQTLLCLGQFFLPHSTTDGILETPCLSCILSVHLSEFCHSYLNY